MVVFSTYAPGGVIRLRQRNDPVTYDSIELQATGPFVTLPIGFGLAVVNSPSGTQTTSATIWYQSITDHSPPA
jgi:hypothetical protein